MFAIFRFNCIIIFQVIHLYCMPTKREGRSKIASELSAGLVWCSGSDSTASSKFLQPFTCYFNIIVLKTKSLTSHILVSEMFRASSCMVVTALRRELQEANY